MPGILKRVHFSAADEYRSAPPTPSPSWSDVSLPSSTGPFTPPPNNAALLPQAMAAVHNALAFRPGAPSTLAYDLCSRPLHGSGHSDDARRMRRMLAEPATNPPQPSLLLVTDLLPYPITVNPGSISSAAASPYSPPRALPVLGTAEAIVAPFVTVGDVIHAIYSFLRIPLTRTEYESLQPVRQSAVNAAFGARVAQIMQADKRDMAYRGGVKRIDLLIAGGRTRFCGLSATKQGPHIWVLNVG